MTPFDQIKCKVWDDSWSLKSLLAAIKFCTNILQSRIEFNVTWLIQQHRAHTSTPIAIACIRFCNESKSIQLQTKANKYCILSHISGVMNGQKFISWPNAFISIAWKWNAMYLSLKAGWCIVYRCVYASYSTRRYCSLSVHPFNFFI